MTTVRILDEAAGELARLDKKVGRKVVKRIQWLATNIDEIKPIALSGDLSGLFKLRSGDDRVIYEHFPVDKLIVIHAIGHRRDVYRRRNR